MKKSYFLLTRYWHFMCSLVVDTVQLKITLWLLGKIHFSKMPVLCFCLYNCRITMCFLSRVVSFRGAGIWRENNRVTSYHWEGMPSRKWKSPLWRELLSVFIAQDNKAGMDLSEIIKLAPEGPDFLFHCHFCVYISNSSHLRDGEISGRKKIQFLQGYHSLMMYYLFLYNLGFFFFL